MRVGVFGGAFNPPHLGHLVCAGEAHAQLALDVVVWAPVGQAPHRDIPADPGAETRLRMCELATTGDERFAVSRIELDRPGPSYTVDTLRELSEHSPDHEPVLILGGDQAAALPSWHEPAEVLRLASVAVAERSGGGERARVEAALAAFDAQVEHFDMPRIDISSTLVRERAAAGRPVRYLVPEAVAELIADEGLYAAPVAS